MLRSVFHNLLTGFAELKNSWRKFGLFLSVLEKNFKRRRKIKYSCDKHFLKLDLLFFSHNYEDVREANGCSFSWQRVFIFKPRATGNVSPPAKDIELPFLQKYVLLWHTLCERTNWNVITGVSFTFFFFVSKLHLNCLTKANFFYFQNFSFSFREEI